MTNTQSIFAPFLTGDRVGDDHVAFCPAHENPATSKKASAQINFERGVWFCFVCIPEAREATLKSLTAVLKQRVEDGEINLDELGPGVEPAAQKADKPATRSKRPVPTEEMVKGWQDTLMGMPKRLSWLIKERHLTMKTIKAWKIGYSNMLHRYTIPVYVDGELVDARCRSTKPSSNDKYIWWRGGTEPPLFGCHMVPQDAKHVVVFEGELDAILAWQLGIPAVSGTAGAKTWKAHWTPWFNDRDVFFCYDTDEAGLRGRARATRAIREVARTTYWIDLDPTSTMDFTDWVGAGHTRSQFDDLIDAARLTPVSEAKSAGDLPTNGEPVTLQESQNAMRDGKAIELNGVMVMGKREPAYSVPKRAEFTCDQGKGAPCKKCSMNLLYNGRTVRDYPANHDLPRAAVESTDDQVRKMLRSDVRARCSDHLDIDIEQKWNVEELIVTDSVENKRSTDYKSNLTRTIYNVGTYDTPVNTSVRIVGEQVSARRDQRGQIFSWVADPVESSIDSFRMTPELFEQLAVYRVQPGERVIDRLQIMANDNAHHVTQIWGRPEIHIATRLTFTSALSIVFLGREMKGTLSGAMPGDTRTGKSEAIQQMVNHWRVGTVVNCDQMTLAGIVGGVTQLLNYWAAKWGIVPQNDRRAVVFDEAGSLAGKDILPAMSSVRSQGVAEIHKIEAARAPARIREIWVFNPPNKQSLANLPEGAMQAIRDLFENPEDIARCDWAMAVGRGEVPSKTINSRHNKNKPPHIYTTDLEHALMLWAWSRKPWQIIFAKGVEDYILELASKVGDLYSADFPLLQAENAKDKFARGAVAVAQAVFSTPDGERVVVRKAHVDTWVRLLNRMYSSDLMGYRRMSLKRQQDEREALENIGDVQKFFDGEKLQMSVDGQRLSKGLMSVGGRFEIRVLAEASNMDTSEAMEGMRWLEDKKMVRRTRGGKWLEPTPALTQILRSLERGDDDDRS